MATKKSADGASSTKKARSSSATKAKAPRAIVSTAGRVNDLTLLGHNIYDQGVNCFKCALCLRGTHTSRLVDWIKEGFCPNRACTSLVAAQSIIPRH